MLYQVSYLWAWCLLAPTDAPAVLPPAASSGRGPVGPKGAIEIETVSQGHTLNEELRVDALEVVVVFREAPAAENLCDLVDVHLKVAQHMVFSLRGVGHTLAASAFRGGW